MVVGCPWTVSSAALKVSRHVPMGTARAPHGCGAPDAQGGVLVKFRLFRLVITVAMLALLVEVLGAGAKWS